MKPDMLMTPTRNQQWAAALASAADFGHGNFARRLSEVIAVEPRSGS